MKYFKNTNNEVFAYDDEQIKQGYGKDLTSIAEDEMKVLTTPVLTQEQIIQQYKSYYLEVFNNKLKELDYDSIATVNMWAIKTNSPFQAEAKALLNWYEAIILKNYEILNAVNDGSREMPTKEQYLSELPLYSAYENQGV